MHVAFDLRYASDHFPGVGRHAHALFEALLEQPGPERYTVLWNPREPSTRFGDFPAFREHPRVSWCERPFAAMSPVSLWQVGAWLRELRPDVYLSPFYFLPIAAGCPCVVTLHDVCPLRVGTPPPPWKSAAYRFLVGRAMRASRVLTVSEFSRDEIVAALGAPAGGVHAVRSGVPARHAVTESRRPARAPDRPFAFNIGANFPYKNLETLVEAWACMGDAAPLDLVVAGPEMSRYPGVAELAARRGLRNVTVLGRVSEAELEWLYDHARLLVFPSTYEGFGFPLVEAFARGLPAIAADIPAFREIDGGAARFVPARDARAWADAVTALASDDAARTRMRERGFARVLELDYRVTAAQVLEHLREVAAPAAVRAAA
jgi:glycosyltransferase involved in cell wall biosynthesis